MRRGGFDVLIRTAIHKEYPEGLYQTKRSWQLATRYGQASIAWCPDRDPAGTELARATARFGMRDTALAHFSSDWIVDIIDLSEWARDNRGHPDVRVPTMAPYPVSDPALLERLTYVSP